MNGRNFRINESMRKALLTPFRIPFCCAKPQPSLGEVVGRQLPVGSSAATPARRTASIPLAAAAVVCFLCTTEGLTTISSTTALQQTTSGTLSTRPRVPERLQLRSSTLLLRLCSSPPALSCSWFHLCLSTPRPLFPPHLLCSLIFILNSVGLPIIFRCLLRSSLYLNF